MSSQANKVDLPRDLIRWPGRADTIIGQARPEMPPLEVL
jgi:hypothetical protein